jgi:acetyl-CoA carboxylase biotin carboxyl carrier protein|tara:strand:- start:53 stop:481 length:429 start_codon:yes stop_codon:yes gene_type:complete
MKIDKKIIKELVDYLSEFNLTELEYQDGDKKIKVSKASKNFVGQNVSDKLVSSNKAVLSEQSDAEGNRIKSPIIGTAYLAPEPGGKPFVKVGDKVKKGQTIMIVEAMKTMNHIPSTSDGTVKKIMVNDGQPVEFGQTLIIIN